MTNAPITALAIPPALDRALTHAVLDEARAAGTTGAAEHDPAHDPEHDAAPETLVAIVGSVVDDLRTQGARASEALRAVEDAFAALHAGQPDDAGRGRVRALDGHARQVAAARLGYGCPGGG
jgi:hypothetical protein